MMKQKGLKEVGNYKLLRKIGQGTFSKVYEAEHIKTKEVFAIKAFDKAKIQKSEQFTKLIKKEIEILKKTGGSPYVIKYIDDPSTQNNIYLVTQFCNGGTLEELIEVDDAGIDEKEATEYLMQILLGFSHLHKFDIMHRDFKPGNIFLHDGQIVIGDLGFANQGLKAACTIAGTNVTMAPEILALKVNQSNDPSFYSSIVDLWSIGVVYYYMIFGKYPFMGNNEKEIYEKILLQGMLQIDPKKRLGWKSVFNHSLFDKMIGSLDWHSPLVQEFIGVRRVIGEETMLNAILLDKQEESIENHGRQSDIQIKDRRITQALESKTNTFQFSGLNLSNTSGDSVTAADGICVKEFETSQQMILKASDNQLKVLSNLPDQFKRLNNFANCHLDIAQGLVDYLTSHPTAKHDRRFVEIAACSMLCLKKFELLFSKMIFQCVGLLKSLKDANYRTIDQYISELKVQCLETQQQISDWMQMWPEASEKNELLTHLHGQLLSNQYATQEFVDFWLKELLRHLLNNYDELRRLEGDSTRRFAACLCHFDEALFFRLKSGLQVNNSIMSGLQFIDESERFKDKHYLTERLKAIMFRLE